MLFDLTGKNIIFTAAASYLGSAMSEALAAYGANVLLTSRDKAKADKIADKYNDMYTGQSSGFALDIEYPESIYNFYRTVLNQYNTIDVIVNNASFSAPDNLHEMPYETWERGINGSINSTFLMIRSILPHMIKNGRGNIINIASMYGIVAPDYHIYKNTGVNCNPANYGVGKAAIIQLTKYIACYYGKDGIRTNVLSPGSFPQDEAKKNTAFIENLSKKNPLNRVGTPDDLKGIIVFLASDASSYMTGQNICVDGGWTSW